MRCSDPFDGVLSGRVVGTLPHRAWVFVYFGVRDWFQSVWPAPRVAKLVRIKQRAPECCTTSEAQKVSA
eukprot:827629-Pyramimonas_sp.AAC.1